ECAEECRSQRRKRLHQNVNFSANCMIRGSPPTVAVDWICPKLALLSAATGALKFTWLITLNTSHRNCTACVVARRNVRVSAKSFCRFAGLTIVNGGKLL